MIEINLNLSEDTEYMQLALLQACKAYSLDEVPVGAIVVQNGKVIASGYNQRETLQLPTAHAEIMALQKAANHIGNWRLHGCSLYVTMEPCAMCAGAMILARIDKVVFSIKDPKGGACGSVFDIANEPKLNHQVIVISGVCEDESRSLVQKFFRQKRQQKKQNTK